MISAYKLTSKEGTTFGGQEWRIGETVRAAGSGNTLCSYDVLHAYRGQLTAVMMNPIHAGYDPARMFLVAGPSPVADDGTKIGMKFQTPVAELDVPRPTLLCRVFFGILCALEVYPDEIYRRWAESYIKGSDRSDANAAANVPAYAAVAATYAAAYAATQAAQVAAYAAVAAADAATYAATYAATHAAQAAAYAANVPIDLERLADKAFHLAGDGG